MSTHATLKADKRTDAGKGVARRLRADARIPGVVYGQGEEATLLSLDAHDTLYLFNRISVENTIVDLEVEGEKEPIATLVREVQVHPFRPEILHVDFYRVQTGVEVEVNVPLHLHGTPVGVKASGGVLQQLENDLPIRCLPRNIPEELTLNIEDLEIGDQKTVADLELPEGTRLALDPDAPLVLVGAPRAEEELEALGPDTEVETPELVGEAEEAEAPEPGAEPAAEEPSED